MSNVAIRVDSGQMIGSGHLMRCLTLAAQLRVAGFAVTFICRAHDGDLSGIASARGFAVHVLPAPSGHGHSPWLGVPQRQDADETRAALPVDRVDWLIVDNYGIDHEWQAALRTRAHRILVIDDLDDRDHDCDVLLDQNYRGEATPVGYEKRVPANCVRLLGPMYALLQPEYSTLAQTVSRRDGEVRRVLVYFGAGDPRNSTLPVLQAMCEAPLRGLGVDIVLGAAHVARERIEVLAASRPGTTVQQGLGTLAGLMLRADLAIGAGGSTTWERACLGLPSLVEVAADNQRAFSRALGSDGFQITLDPAAALDAQSWFREISDACADPVRLERMAQKTRQLVDGFGAQRVLAHLMSLRNDPLEHRNALEIFAPDVTSRENTAKLQVRERGGTPLACLTLRKESGLPQYRVSLDTPGLAANRPMRAAALGALLRSPASADGFVRLDADAKSIEPAPTAPLRVTLLTDRSSWVNRELEFFAARLLEQGYALRWIHDAQALLPGDVCFILSFSAIVRAGHRALNRHNLVVHASDLPRGRGWSPTTWKILAGVHEIPLSLFEAADSVDAGVVYLRDTMRLDGTELVDVWRERLAMASVRLCERWLSEFPTIATRGEPQVGEPSYYARRRPQDSALDPGRTLAEQFELLRVVDNENYPAFFEFRGQRYELLVRTRGALPIHGDKT